jgi:hypothetical protein
MRSGMLYGLLSYRLSATLLACLSGIEAKRDASLSAGLLPGRINADAGDKLMCSSKPRLT